MFWAEAEMEEYYRLHTGLYADVIVVLDLPPREEHSIVIP